MLAGLVLALVIFFLFIFSLKWLTHHAEAKTVPSVVGKTFSEAESILEKSGFEVEIQDSIYVDTVPPLKVIKQVPEDGEVVKVNRTVYLTINRSVPPMIEMPDLGGYSFRSAEMELKNLGLRLGIQRIDPIMQRTPYWNSGIMHDHQAGHQIRMGSQISFVLGTGVGTEKFIVRDFTGMTFCQAKSMIEANGLLVGSVIIRPGADITDTCSAYIYQQKPEPFDSDKKIQYIRTGQTIDLFLQKERPVTDSLAVPLQGQ
jgi:beta-lactam-binding protein with PASTA domain